MSRPDSPLPPAVTLVHPPSFGTGTSTRRHGPKEESVSITTYGRGRADGTGKLYQPEEEPDLVSISSDVVNSDSEDSLMIMMDGVEPMTTPSKTTTKAASTVVENQREDMMVMGGVLTNIGKMMDAREYYEKALLNGFSCHEDTAVATTTGSQERCMAVDNRSSSSLGMTNSYWNAPSKVQTRMIPVTTARTSSSNTSTLSTKPKLKLTSSWAANACTAGGVGAGVAVFQTAQNRAPNKKVLLAQYAVKCGKLDEARKLYTQALDEIYGIYGNNPKTHEVANIWVALGRLSAKELRHDEAVNYFQKALSIKQDVYGPENTENDDLMACTENLGHIACNLGKYEQALDYYKVSLKMFYGIHAPTAAKTQSNLKTLSLKLDNLGKLSSLVGQYDASRIFYHEGLQLKRELYGPEKCTTDVCRSLDALGNVHRILGDYSSARQYLTQELLMLHKIYGSQAQTKEIALVLNNLGNLNCNLDQFHLAQDYYDKALEIKYHCYGPDAQNMSLATTLHSLGILHSELGKYQLAEDFFRKALAMKYHVFGREANNVTIANTVNRLVVIQASSRCIVWHNNMLCHTGIIILLYGTCTSIAPT